MFATIFNVVKKPLVAFVIGIGAGVAADEVVRRGTRWYAARKVEKEAAELKQAA